MNKLWIQLTVAFGLVTLTGVLIVALLTNMQVSSEFRSFVAQSQVQGSPLLSELSDYYVQHASWQGAETLLREFTATRRGAIGRGGPSIVLADSSGHIIYSDTPNQVGTTLAPADRAAATAIPANGQMSGYLLIRAGSGGAMSPAGQQFLARVNRSLLQAGVLAGVLGLILGLIIARNLAAPLSRLSTAAGQVAQGKFDQRVPIAGAAEVADVARAFNDMAAGLQQSEQLRQHMIADIAHELRTPLTVIQGNLRALLDDVYPLEKGEIATIYDETIVLNRLVSDLRELAKAEAGQLELHMHPLDTSALLRSALAPFEVNAAAQGIAIATQLPATLPTAQADPERVRQVLRNLLANALRYTPAGGTITLSAAQAANTGWLRVAVRDTGAGIAAADLPHVFERFWRADRSRSRDQGGSGLGLAIAKQIVEAHGGQIGATSEPSQGSEFWFTLPIADMQNHIPPTLPPTPMQKGSLTQ